MCPRLKRLRRRTFALDRRWNDRSANAAVSEVLHTLARHVHGERRRRAQSEWLLESQPSDRVSVAAVSATQSTYLPETQTALASNLVSASAAAVSSSSSSSPSSSPSVRVQTLHRRNLHDRPMRLNQGLIRAVAAVRAAMRVGVDSYLSVEVTNRRFVRRMLDAVRWVRSNFPQFP